MKAAFFSWGVLLLAAASTLADEKGEAAPVPPASTLVVDSPAVQPAAAPAPPEIVAQLEALVKDLLMPSETDAPIRVFWAKETLDEPKAADYARWAGLKLKGDEEVETRSLADLLDGPAREQEWMNDEEKATARRFAALRAFLNANFAEIEVFAIGDAEKQIVVAGRYEGGFAGIVTLVVET